MLLVALNAFGVLYPWMVEGGSVRVANCLRLACGVVLLTADAGHPRRPPLEVGTAPRAQACGRRFAA